jgi:hypothetical protein
LPAAFLLSQENVGIALVTGTCHITKKRNMPRCAASCAFVGGFAIICRNGAALFTSRTFLYPCHRMRK